MIPPTPAPDLPLPKAARVINIITALTGVVASGLFGLVQIYVAIFIYGTGAPPIIALLIIALLIFVVLCWSWSAYRAAFTRFKRFPLARLLFQTFLMGHLLWGSAIFFQSTHPLSEGEPLWHPTAAWVLLVLISLTLLSHLLSLAIRLLHPPSQPGST